MSLWRETLPIREAFSGCRNGIAGQDERSAANLIHTRNGIGLDDFPQIVRNKAAATGQAMSFSILVGAQSVSPVDVKSEMPVRLSALMANQLTATTPERAVLAVAIC